MVKDVELTRLANRIRKLDAAERKRLARLLREPKPKSRRQTEQERIDELEREYYAAHQDIPVDRELLALVGTVPDDGKTIAEIVMEGYDRSQRSR